MSNGGNFRVRCVKVGKFNSRLHTTGKIYKIENGRITCDDSTMLPTALTCFESVDDLNKWSSSEFELIPEPKQFTKADLRTGMRAKLRCGKRMVYIDSEIAKGFVRGDESLYIEWFDDNLIGTDSRDEGKYDVMEIFEPPKMLIDVVNLDANTKLLWKRPEPRKMTVKEAEQYISEQLEETIVIEG